MLNVHAEAGQDILHLGEFIGQDNSQRSVASREEGQERPQPGGAP